MRFQDWFLENSIYIYVTLAMVMTWLVQMYRGRKLKLTILDRFSDSFICSLFTASVCLPLLESFPELPKSISLLVGGIVGTLGFNGFEAFSKSTVKFFSNKVGVDVDFSIKEKEAQEAQEHYTFKSCKRRTENVTKVKSTIEEPPMPTKRSLK